MPQNEIEKNESKANDKLVSVTQPEAPVSEVDVRIDNRLGLHARAAARFVHLANRFESTIHVSKAGSRVDGKSILGLLTLAACKGTRLRLVASGVDEDQALAELSALVRDRFGEES